VSDSSADVPAGDNVLLVGGPWHLLPLRLDEEPRNLPPTLRTPVLWGCNGYEDKVMVMYPLARREEDGLARYLYDFADNCYARTSYATVNGLTIYAWIDEGGIPDPAPPHLLAAGLVKCGEGCYADEAALARADLT
jgi:hypothetical protein